MSGDDKKDTSDAAAPKSDNSGHEHTNAAAQYLTPSVRWNDAAVHTQAKVLSESAGEGPSSDNTARARWKRAIFYAQRLGDPDRMLEGAGYDPGEEDMVRKNLEEQHWLEMIDSKHRYGSNMKFYHRVWKDSDTTENFFYWLDEGGGKDLSLKECSREQLDSECIIYLSSEQRLNYLVRIDEQGRLRWARNDTLVDTKAGRWKDSGNGQGIVPMDSSDGAEPKPSFRHNGGTVSPASSSSSLSQVAAQHYGDQEIEGNAVTRWIRKNFTRKGVMVKLLRKTVKRNTWIYVSDKQFNIFIGIKETGHFQHSSFLAGGIATSAGLISVKLGVIRKLSPLSGHYRTSIDHFRQFIKILDERGVDMHKAEISRAELALWGIEHLTKAQKAKSRMIQDGKVAVKDVVDKGRTTSSNTDEGHVDQETKSKKPDQ